nr:MAG TPA: acetyltransferase [Caudoviricetes sp.]
MKTVIYNLPCVSKFVSDRIPGNDEFSPTDANLGLLKGGKLVAGVVFNMYTGTGICMHVAAEGKDWMSREFLRATFRYPFVQLGCRRVTGLVRTDNLAAQKFDEHLGFKREGLIREGDDDGCDLILYGMLAKECRWLNI